MTSSLQPTSSVRTREDQIVEMLTAAESRNILLVGAPGMGKSKSLLLALAQIELSETPIRLVCSKSQQQVRLGVLAPFLKTARTSEISERQAVHELSSMILAGDVPRLVIVEEGEFMDTASAYVLNLLATLQKIRLLVVSTDIDQDDEINEILLANSSAVPLVIEPMDFDQLQGELGRRFDMPMSLGAQLAIYRVSGGIPEIFDAVVKQLLDTQPPSESSPWALKHPLDFSGHGFLSRMQDLVSRLDSDTVDVYWRLATAGHLQVDGVKSLGSERISRLLRTGYVSLSGDEITAKSSALLNYIAQFSPELNPEQQAKNAERSSHWLRVLTREELLSYGHSNIAAARALTPAEGIEAKHAFLAAREIEGKLEYLGSPMVNSPRRNDDGPHQKFQEALSELSTAFNAMDLEGCDLPVQQLIALERQYPNSWYPRIQWIVHGVLATLFRHGPDQALELLTSIQQSAPPLWRERIHGVHSLCTAVVANSAANFKDARAFAGEALAEFECNDAFGLMEITRTLHESLVNVVAREPMPAPPPISELINQQDSTGVHLLLQPLWFYALALSLANSSRVTDDLLEAAAEGNKLTDDSWWAVSVPLTIHMLTKPNSGLKTLAEEKIRSFGKINQLSSLTDVLVAAGCSNVEHIQASRKCYDRGYRFAAYLIARSVRLEDDTDQRAYKSHNIAEIIQEVRHAMSTEGLNMDEQRVIAEDQLTRRELEIIKLAKAGATNREIAEKLFLSTRTVEGHLYRAYNKLEVTTREDLDVIVFF